MDGTGRLLAFPFGLRYIFRGVCCSTSGGHVSHQVRNKVKNPQKDRGIIKLSSLGESNNAKCMGVSKNNGTPKWMVNIMENPIKMDDLGVPLFLETPVWVF